MLPGPLAVRSASRYALDDLKISERRALTIPLSKLQNIKISPSLQSSPFLLSALPPFPLSARPSCPERARTATSSPRRAYGPRAPSPAPPTRATLTSPSPLRSPHFPSPTHPSAETTIRNHHPRPPPPSPARAQTPTIPPRLPHPHFAERGHEAARPHCLHKETSIGVTFQWKTCRQLDENHVLGH